jgi:hypothetical protein
MKYIFVNLRGYSNWMLGWEMCTFSIILIKKPLKVKKKKKNLYKL